MFIFCADMIDQHANGIVVIKRSEGGESIETSYAIEK
jgi:hypothetical protein